MNIDRRRRCPGRPRRALAAVSNLDHAGLRVLRHTRKTLLLAGTCDDTEAIVKIQLSNDVYWQRAFSREVAAYRLFALSLPPITAPRLLHADDTCVLVVERADGATLAVERYPYRISTDSVRAAVAALERFAVWPLPTHGRAVLPRVFDYAERIDRFRGRGLLTGSDAAALTNLLAHSDPHWEPAHGDAIPSNILLTTDGQVVLLDWEFCGLYLPGWDLALLRTCLSRTADITRWIDDRASARQIQVPYAINLAMALTREIHIHQKLPATSDRDQLLDHLAGQWQQARTTLHQLAGSDSDSPNH